MIELVVGVTALALYYCLTLIIMRVCDVIWIEAVQVTVWITISLIIAYYIGVELLEVITEVI